MQAGGREFESRTLHAGLRVVEGENQGAGSALGQQSDENNTPCPETCADWEALLEARRLTLGLPAEHGLSPFEHEVFLPALP